METPISLWQAVFIFNLQVRIGFVLAGSSERHPDISNPLRRNVSSCQQKYDLQDGIFFITFTCYKGFRWHRVLHFMKIEKNLTKIKEIHGVSYRRPRETFKLVLSLITCLLQVWAFQKNIKSRQFTVIWNKKSTGRNILWINFLSLKLKFNI